MWRRRLAGGRCAVRLSAEDEAPAAPVSRRRARARAWFTPMSSTDVKYRQDVVGWSLSGHLTPLPAIV